MTSNRILRHALPTLTNYLLVSQTLPLIEHYIRQANDTWNLSTVSILEESVSCYY